MEEIILVRPTLEYGEDIWQFRQEIAQAGDADSFAGCSGLEKEESVEAWIKRIEERERQETCPADRTPSNVYLALRKSDNRIVGIIDLRHHIEHPVLKLWGGHIGYSVRPSERGKGYAKEMLRLNLENARALGIPKVMITCDEDNAASEKTILANGGVYEKTVCVEGQNIKRYWITL
ncbi:MAG: GNAT family N-acetyltransferase [Roseburia sp.]